MQSVRATAPLIQQIDLEEIAAWARGFERVTRGFERVTLDLGAGDGRFARDLARRQPARGVIAVDTAGENFRDSARRAPDNARFITGDALALPDQIYTLADEITINFPWGSLLRALLAGDERLLRVLRGRDCTIRVNAGAMAEAEYDFDAGREALVRTMRLTSPRALKWQLLGRDELRRIPTTWAKRLAFGRDPRGVEVVV